ncbi:SgcJ/EcaC family oxidoreductase [Candidatus Wolbachia massiliensis]|uniref:SgcJ/EcaC family oxidoreductase n=2 Tax=Candidatus Wolbachia massiliensis TaxID=1845000 RepID=A0A7M3U354_9RICK|nr:SgcJ/EcaC family oxidoreductase [Candidatus Wolbachia massiliensis]
MVCRKGVILILSFLLIILALVVIVQTFTRSQSCIKVNDQDIEALFDRWNDSLKTGDAYKVDANYTDDAVLLTTLSSHSRITSAQRIDYFKNFLTKYPTARIDSRTVKIGCNKAVDTGLYTFKLKDGEELRARYTFTYRWGNNKWLISSHHSSLPPQDHS